jgi:hypothetical protein
MADPIDEFVKRLKSAADEARLTKRVSKASALSELRKAQKQIPMSLFHDMFGEDVRASGSLSRASR